MTARQAVKEGTEWQEGGGGVALEASCHLEVSRAEATRGLSDTLQEFGFYLESNETQRVESRQETGSDV